ncbi:uncharacterized protein LOC135209141 isoform X2 [Macrobrachium nipponense]|uniref:uncharacterized protein LOC135209141 isoform X2 n=1 Tax=Macrobrachium nipponense TaxID=159736 RepID=UPI0030C89492
MKSIHTGAQILRKCSAVGRGRPPLGRCMQSIASGKEANDRKEENVVRSPFPPVELPNSTVPDLLFSRARNWSAHDAIECGITGRKYTYGGMIDRALRWGAAVNKVMPPGARKNVALYCQNAPEFPVVLLGTLAVGGMVTTINHNFTADEVSRQLQDSHGELVVVDPLMEGLLRQVLAKLNLQLPVFTNGPSQFGSPNLQEIIEDTTQPFAEVAETNPESIAMMLYSSGTTGKPKGVALSHRAFTNNMVMFAQPHTFAYRDTSAEYQENILGIMPFYHIYGTHVINMLNMYMGAKTISLPAFTPKDLIRIIRDFKVEVVHLVPPMLNFLSKSEAVTSRDLASMRVAMCAAAPVPPSSALALKEKAPNPVLFQEGFGMTEALGTHLTPPDQERIGYCGKLVSNVEGKVIDIETGEALPEGQRGEMCLRSPSMMSYYHNNPKATAETIDSEGWLHTGDVAVHEDGFFSIVDRIKELIKVKGYQVSPSELEEELLKHPAVMDVGVVGVEDERAGELPRAYVVRKTQITTEDIMDYMKERLAPYKQLKGGIRFLDALPKNATGKLLRRELKEMAAQDP